jgi:hypothetical protein
MVWILGRANKLSHASSFGAAAAVATRPGGGQLQQFRPGRLSPKWCSWVIRPDRKGLSKAGASHVYGRACVAIRGRRRGGTAMLHRPRTPSPKDQIYDDSSPVHARPRRPGSCRAEHRTIDGHADYDDASTLPEPAGSVGSNGVGSNGKDNDGRERRTAGQHGSDHLGEAAGPCRCKVRSRLPRRITSAAAGRQRLAVVENRELVVLVQVQALLNRPVCLADSRLVL